MKFRSKVFLKPMDGQKLSPLTCLSTLMGNNNSLDCLNPRTFFFWFVLKETFKSNGNKLFTFLISGWGDKIQWMSLTDGLQRAKREGRMAIVVVSKERCAACNQLKKRFRESHEIHKLSNNFIMIRVASDEVSSNIKYKPDGNYVPRVFFLDTEGQVMKDVIRDTNVRKWKYNYATEDQLLANMKRLLRENQ